MLPGFIHIGPRASLYTPSQPVNGQLVIICTWLGAKGKHIAKYTSLYQRIAPGARILLIESNVSILVSSYARQRSDIRPAAAAVMETLAECGHHDGSIGDIGIDNKEKEPPSASEHATPRGTGHMPTTTPPTPPPSTASSSSSSTASLPTTTAPAAGTPPPKLVLHSFSNGGTNTATQLLIVLQTRLDSPLPLAGLVLDSCPAKGTYWKSYQAMVRSLPRSDAGTRLLGAVAVHLLLTLLYAWIGCGNENPAGLMRRTLLDGRTVAARRLCYLYSVADSMVEWADVRDHALEAREGGWCVDEELFDASAHCAHLSMYEDRYVRAVEGVWTGGCVDDEKVVVGRRTRTKL